MKYKPENDLPEFARENKTLSPSELSRIILNRRNREVTPESVTMWFKRHPNVYEQLEKELVEGLPTGKEEVNASVFQNGQFEQIPSVKNWVLEMDARELSKATLSTKVSTLKQLCQGRFSMLKIDLVAEGKWCLKHPDRLTLQDALGIISALKAKDVDTTFFKHVLKDFLLSKGVVIGKKIVVGRSKSFGQYAKLHVDMPTLSLMLEWIKSVNFEAYVADEFMLKTAARISASLNALIENMTQIGEHATITIFDKGRRSKYPRGHPWEKHLDAQLQTDMATLIGDRKAGKIFNIKKDVLAELNRKAVQRFCPEVLARYPDLMPNHFWRHMFAQHMLRRTAWNYALVANLGGWTPQALEESYGKPPDEVVKEWASEYQLTFEAAVS